MNTRKCPKCGSEDVEIIDEEMGFIKCKKCGYNELEEDLGSSDTRNTQREKGSYNIYKTGGHERTMKKK